MLVFCDLFVLYLELLELMAGVGRRVIFHDQVGYVISILRCHIAGSVVIVVGAAEADGWSGAPGHLAQVGTGTMTLYPALH